MGVVRMVRVVDERHHGAAMCLGATDAGLARLLQHPRRDRHRRVRGERPVRDQQRPAAGVEERLDVVSG